MAQATEKMESWRLNVRGVVQGVGFRPFVYRLAQENGLKGWVCNTSSDVTIVLEGAPAALARFRKELKASPPPRSRIESISVRREPFSGYERFEIQPSQSQEGGYQLVSPDLAICPDCCREIADPADRRYGYAFTNCTNCGPRFTIIEDIPYDRPRTTMASFCMCPACQKEYDDPLDRRFHAQPNACPVCGPHLKLMDRAGHLVAEKTAALARAEQLLGQGEIVAVKGLGGFQLACDAQNEDAVRRLRDRKRRPAKPFAVMVATLEEARRLAEVSLEEAKVLTSPQAPIVLLRRRTGSSLAPLVAPGLKYVGLMLPGTPLHHLLLKKVARPLVMTSGNLSEEPIAKDNGEAVQRLGDIADYFLAHNRDIYSCYDDSVVMVAAGRTQVLRRARGYAPNPLALVFPARPVLACGAEQKNTFCLTRDNHAFLSQHIGDMENQETLDHFEATVALYEKLFRIKPEIIACDRHPDYLPTRWAEARAAGEGLPLVRVQHHHAHLASCLADNGVAGPAIGVALDGAGYGDDGHIWGGEFGVADYIAFTRRVHLEYLPLPGGDAAVKRPYRTAIAYLYRLLGPASLGPDLPCFKGVAKVELDLIKQQVDRGLNSPLTSSMGRLFDAVAALLGLRREIEYEGQAAIELEMIADDAETGVYPFDIISEEIKLEDLLAAVLADVVQKTTPPVIAARFHNTAARMVRDVAFRISRETGLRQVALSGGVFQNRRLLTQAIRELMNMGLTPLWHREAPANDGGIALGQAVIAARKEIT
jgi:hydrogenase maturation protein HypF